MTHVIQELGVRHDKVKASLQVLEAALQGVPQIAQGVLHVLVALENGRNEQSILRARESFSVVCGVLTALDTRLRGLGPQSMNGHVAAGPQDGSHPEPVALRRGPQRLRVEPPEVLPGRRRVVELEGRPTLPVVEEVGQDAVGLRVHTCSANEIMRCSLTIEQTENLYYFGKGIQILVKFNNLKQK